MYAPMRRPLWPKLVIGDVADHEPARVVIGSRSPWPKRSDNS
jgi:hypothetical protein